MLSSKKLSALSVLTFNYIKKDFFFHFQSKTFEKCLQFFFRAIFPHLDCMLMKRIDNYLAMKWKWFRILTLIIVPSFAVGITKRLIREGNFNLIIKNLKNSPFFTANEMRQQRSMIDLRKMKMKLNFDRLLRRPLREIFIFQACHQIWPLLYNSVGLTLKFWTSRQKTVLYVEKLVIV